MWWGASSNLTNQKWGARKGARKGVRKHVRKHACKGVRKHACKGERKCARKCVRRDDGDCEPSAKRSNAEACAKVRANAHAKVRAGMMGIVNQVQKGQMQRCAQTRMQRCAQGWWGLWTKCKKVKCRGARKGACTKVRAGMMGIVNQVQKGQMQRRVQKCAQMRAQRYAQGWWGLWTKCKKVKCRGARFEYIKAFINFIHQFKIQLQVCFIKI